MTEQSYKEITVAIKYSGIPLDIQKELQSLVDREFIKEGESDKSNSETSLRG